MNKKKKVNQEITQLKELFNTNKLYSKQISEMISRASIAQDILSNLQIDTSTVTQLAKAQSEALKSLPNITKFQIPDFTRDIRLINRQLFELNKIDLSGINSIAKNFQSQITIVNTSWKEMFDINQKIHSVFSESLMSQIHDLNSFTIDPQLIDLTVNSAKVFEALHSDLQSLPSEIKSEVIDEIGTDESEIEDTLLVVKKNIETYGIDNFWKSRTTNELKNKPEDNAQDLTATNLRSLLGKKFTIHSQSKRGVGLIDVLLNYVDRQGNISEYLVEIKIIKDGDDIETGIKQLFDYQITSDIRRATRLIFNASKKSLSLNDRYEDGYYQRDIVININPIPPSKLK